MTWMNRQPMIIPQGRSGGGSQQASASTGATGGRNGYVLRAERRRHGPLSQERSVTGWLRREQFYIGHRVNRWSIYRRPVSSRAITILWISLVPS